MSGQAIIWGRKVAIVSVMLAVAACAEENANVNAFDGQYFRTKTSKANDDRAEFVAEIRDVAASIDGAREAGRYEGTKYCITNFGTSRIDWIIGPDTAPETLTITDNTLTFQGRCRA